MSFAGFALLSRNEVIDQTTLQGRLVNVDKITRVELLLTLKVD